MATDNQILESYRAVYLTAEDLRVAASILYNAYHDDPFFIESFHSGDLAMYEQKLRGAIREELNELWQQEQTLIGLFEGERMLGVACIVSQLLPLGESRYWHWRLKMLISTGWQSTQALIKKETCLLEHLPSPNCGILQFIAVSPIEQKKGLGSQLVQAVLSWCDEQPEMDGVGVFASEHKHVHLFSQHGFSVLETLFIGKVEGELLFYRGQDNK
ncbi:GNAT family N-acetyltransferase [Shewanella violacea]|uniref:Acetyltransferase, GNAT family n=1 Tax=Shewanella violacea (strain JCM 10179 / CIP 106290 / LMG 19151 / DSS12) TaxID=637905 RepID=D4ZHN9_SHEVD|nr:GNAT family N-acetyltransferase [Shewanella violacea]BAJ01188.1 acetyltransferase, GNAT family [Shewanella violacea DSS12]